MDKYKNFSVDDFLNDKFFNQWVKGTCEKDCEVWEHWIENNPEKEALVQHARQIILSFKYEPRELSDNFYANLKLRIDESLKAEEPAKLKRFPIIKALKLAAIFTGLIIGAYFLLKSDDKVNLLTYNSKYAETKKFILPDSSEVILNANSSITYKDNDEASGREVWLKGEAYFKVKHIEALKRNPVKFTVHTKDINVQVLGTQFNVNSNDDNETEVLLTKGKVTLSIPGKAIHPITMSPDDLVSYNNKTDKVSLNKVAPTNYIAWLDHKYVLDKTSLEDLSKGLNRFYGSSITFKDKEMRKQQLSGTLELQDEETLIKTLSALLGVSVEKTGNQIVIGSK